jgi:uncharacterized repeat protein (TIGR03837 family)
VNARTVLWLFCRVVDNFGDAGVCWRLARQLQSEHGFEVSVFIDAPQTLAAIAPGIAWDRAAAFDTVGPGLRALSWRPEDESAMLARAHPDPRVLVSGFGCDLPASARALAGRPQHPPLWINLEYLSAEPWVEAFHGRPSPKPGDGAVEHFYFPGFTTGTGGLLRESRLEQTRQSFISSPECAEFLARLGIDAADRRARISLFCYPDAPLAAWFETLRTGERPSRVLVAQPCAAAAFSAAGADPRAGRFASGALLLERLPMLSQYDYDRLLWCCDLNLVRGEDSWIRAHWARRPFIWQPYPQQAMGHLAKLEAFIGQIDAMTGPASKPALNRAANMMRAWSAGPHADQLAHCWQHYIEAIDAIALLHERWAQGLVTQSGLAERLVEFIEDQL